MVIAVVTQVVLVWDRAAHSMVGPHTVGEAILAWVLWSCCLLASFGVPVGLASLTPHASRRPRWPIAEFIAVVIGIFLVFYLLFFVQGLPSGFSDNVVLLAYPPAAVGYAFAAKKIVASWRARSRVRVLASGVAMWLAGAVMIMMSWAIVFFE